MCECKNLNRTQVAEHFEKKLAGKAQVEPTATQHNAGIMMQGNKLVMVGIDTFHVRTYPLKKDGTKTGKEKMEVMEIVHSYCPHCGEEYPTE